MIRSIADLQQMKEAYLEKDGGNIHTCAWCATVQDVCLPAVKNVRDAMVEELEKAGLSDKVAVIEKRLHGDLCGGPVVYVLPDETYYTEMTPGRSKMLCRSTLLGENRSQNILSMTAFRRNGSQ